MLRSGLSGAFGFLNTPLSPAAGDSWSGAWSGNSPQHWCVTVHQLLYRDALHSAKLWFIVLVFVLDGMSSWCNSRPKPCPTTLQGFFNYQKQTKKLPKLGKYDHKDDNVEKGEYDTSHGLIMASAHNTTFYYNSLHCTASASATLVKLTSSNIGRCVMIAEFLNVNFYTNLKLPTQCLPSKVSYPFILPKLWPSRMSDKIH